MNQIEVIAKEINDTFFPEKYHIETIKAILTRHLSPVVDEARMKDAYKYCQSKLDETPIEELENLYIESIRMYMPTAIQAKPEIDSSVGYEAFTERLESLGYSPTSQQKIMKAVIDCLPHCNYSKVPATPDRETIRNEVIDECKRFIREKNPRKEVDYEAGIGDQAYRNGRNIAIRDAIYTLEQLKSQVK